MFFHTTIVTLLLDTLHVEIIAGRRNPKVALKLCYRGVNGIFQIRLYMQVKFQGFFVRHVKF